MNRDRLLKIIVTLYAIAVIVALGSLVSRSKWFQFKKDKKAQSGSVAVLHIYGPIQTSMSSSGWGRQDADDIARRLHRWSENEDIKVILIRINSPGGTIGGVQEIYREVVRCKAKGKKIVASMGDIAASGGYYIAAAADKIIANPGTITGSIGVLFQFGNVEGLLEKVGVRVNVIKSGPHKDIGSPVRGLTPEERRMLQSSIDDAYAQFVEAVVAGRSMPKEKVQRLADGRIYTGREAQQAGLVDELGNRHDALQLARQLANLSPRSPVLTDMPRSLGSLIRHLSSRFTPSFWETLQSPTTRFRLEYSLR